MKAGSITGMDGELIYQTAKTREEGMSTGIEKGIAIPHARLTGAPGFLVVFGRSEFGIDWNSPDGVPARLFFFVLSAPDETDTQLRVYRQILEVLSEDETIASLLRAKSVRAATELLNDRLRVSAITGDYYQLGIVLYGFKHAFIVIQTGRCNCPTHHSFQCCSSRITMNVVILYFSTLHGLTISL
jgi:mannitol/fructose-specific phosphotransferase system IIA component (Ntr-type)